MSTESEKGFLDREKMIMAAKPIIEFASPMLQEIVNYSTQLLAKLLHSAVGGDELLAVHVPYLHLIEMIDALEVQTTQAVVEPAKTSLRSAFESLLTINYVLENEPNYTNRALSFVIEDIHNRIKIYKQLDATTQAHKDLKQALASDKLGSAMESPTLSDAGNRIKKLENRLNKPPHDAIEAEYQRTQMARKGRKPYWYSLFNGPENLERLAYHLKLLGTYKILYPAWSNVVHGKGIYAKLVKGPDGGPALKGLREITEIKSTIQFAASFCFEATRSIIRKYLPEEEYGFNKWYTKEVRTSFLKL